MKQTEPNYGVWAVQATYENGERAFLCAYPTEEVAKVVQRLGMEHVPFLAWERMPVPIVLEQDNMRYVLKEILNLYDRATR